MRVHAIFIEFCLLLVATLIYSRLTGYDLGLRELVGSKVMGNIVFYLYLLFVLGGLSILYLKKVNTSVSGVFVESINLVIAIFLICSLVIVVGLTISKPFNIEETVRFYVAPFAFYLLPIAAWFSVFMFARGKYLISSEKSLAIFAIASFLLGLILYVVKSQFDLLGDVNATAQLILVALCLVFPSFYFLLGVVIGFLKYKNQQQLAKGALSVSLLGAATFPLLSVLV
jgi:hypothetical protein